MNTTPQNIYDAKSIKGSKRDVNKDNFAVIQGENYRLFCLFDGVSSAENGLKSTEIAIECIRLYHHKYLTNEPDLPRLLYMANNDIIVSGYRNALTTVLAVCFHKKYIDHVYYTSLGDTRLYGIHQSYISQYTEDDVLPDKPNILSKCLGIPVADSSEFILNKVKISEEYLIMCTDGFYNVMDKNLIRFYDTIKRFGNDNIGLRLSRLIAQKNIDDATFIFIRSNNVFNGI